jgi:hypothetical protein
MSSANTPLSRCKSCGRQIIFAVNENGKTLPFNAVPNGSGGWKPGALHFETCPVEKVKREKTNCPLCRLAHGADPLELADLISEPHFCLEDAARGWRFIPSLHRSVCADRLALVEVYREAKRKRMKMKKMEEKAEGTAKLDSFYLA